MTPSLLLPYQKRWLEDTSEVKVYEKSRRIGITWTMALEAVLTASGGQDVFYMGYSQQLADEFIRLCTKWTEKVHDSLKKVHGVKLYEEYIEDRKKPILAKKIRFPNKNHIMSMTSAPRNLRGHEGLIIIDEAAFHNNLAEVMEAALANTMWVGRVAIISTHYGVANEFYYMVENIRAGRLNYSLHRTTLDDALSDGLFHVISEKRGKPWSKEEEEKWRESLLDKYKEKANQELFCIPYKATGVYIQPLLIERAFCSEYPVIRYEVDDNFAMKDEATRERLVACWYEDKIVPLLRKLDQSKGHFLGQDFGRKSDISSIAVGCWSQKMILEVPFIIELTNVPFEQQKSISVRLIKDLPNFNRAAVDATGNGSYLAEVLTQAKGPTLVDAVQITEKWYSENLPVFRSRFEDNMIRIPQDYDIRQDLLMFEYVDGIPKLPKQRRDAKSSSVKRHGDSAVALALMEFASRVGQILYKYEKVDRGGTFNKSKPFW